MSASSTYSVLLCMWTPLPVVCACVCCRSNLHTWPVEMFGTVEWSEQCNFKRTPSNSNWQASKYNEAWPPFWASVWLEHIRMDDLSKNVWLRKIWNRTEFTANTKNSNTHCTYCLEISHFVDVAKHACDQSVFYRFNNFTLTTGFYWSYMLLFNRPFLCALGDRQINLSRALQSSILIPVANASASDRCAFIRRYMRGGREQRVLATIHLVAFLHLCSCIHSRYCLY